MQGIIWSLHLSQHSVPALLAYSRHCVSQDRWKSVLVCSFCFLCFCVCACFSFHSSLLQRVWNRLFVSRPQKNRKTVRWKQFITFTNQNEREWSTWRSLDSTVLHLILTHQEKPITYISVITRQKLVIFLWLLSLSSQPLGTISIHSHHTTFPGGSLTSGRAIHRWDRWVRKWLVHGAWQIWGIWHWRLRVSRGGW